MILIESFRTSICIAEGLCSKDVDAVIGIIAIGCEIRAEDVRYETSLEKKKVKVMKSTRRQATNQGCHRHSWCLPTMYNRGARIN
jgi:hypothetical protein